MCIQPISSTSFQPICTYNWTCAAMHNTKWSKHKQPRVSPLVSVFRLDTQMSRRLKWYFLLPCVSWLHPSVPQTKLTHLSYRWLPSAVWLERVTAASLCCPQMLWYMSLKHSTTAQTGVSSCNPTLAHHTQMISHWQTLYIYSVVMLQHTQMYTKTWCETRSAVVHTESMPKSQKSCNFISACT